MNPDNSELLEQAEYQLEKARSTGLNLPTQAFALTSIAASLLVIARSLESNNFNTSK